MPDWDRIGGGEDPGRADRLRPGEREAGTGRVVRQIPVEAFRALVQGSDEGIMLADADGRVLFANHACERLVGVSAERLVGRFGMELTRPEHALLSREIFKRVLASPGEPIHATIDLRRPGGDVVTVDVKAVNHLSTPGIEALVGYLRESGSADSGAGNSYRALFDNALVGMGVADMQGNLLAFNDAMLRPGGYTREDIVRIGNVARLYASDADRSRVLQILRAKGHVWRERVPFLRKDGSTYDTLMTLTPVAFLGRPCLYATVEIVDESGRPAPPR